MRAASSKKSHEAEKAWRIRVVVRALDAGSLPVACQNLVRTIRLLRARCIEGPRCECGGPRICTETESGFARAINKSLMKIYREYYEKLFNGW